MPVCEDSPLKIRRYPMLELVSSFLSLCFGSGSTGGCSQSEKHEREERGLEPEEMLLRKRLKLEGDVCRHQREIDDLRHSVEELQD